MSWLMGSLTPAPEPEEVVDNVLSLHADVQEFRIFTEDGSWKQDPSVRMWRIYEMEAMGGWTKKG